MEQVPDTLSYMILGYVVLFGLPLLYVLSWWFRRRNLEKDIEVLKSLEEENARK